MTDQHIEINDPHGQVEKYKRLHDAIVQMVLVSELETLLKKIVELVKELVTCERVMILTLDEEEISLCLAIINKPLAEKALHQRLKNAHLNTFNQEHDPIIGQWLQGHSVLYPHADEQPPSSATDYMALVNFQRYFSIPLLADDRLISVIVVEISEEKPLSALDQELLETFGESAAAVLHTTQFHTRTVDKLANSMNEMTMIQQIDRELNETIELNTVFNMALDWALRFTNANAATIALYENETDGLRTMFNYGYQISDRELETLRDQTNQTISHRVARTGRVEVVADVLMDGATEWVAPGMRAQMAVPVMREDRVIAVITLESKKFNAFNDRHISFVEKLANRAGVAIDNARLYSETELERGKLSYILGNIGDIVIVIDRNGRILLISQSAISALQLSSEVDYTNKAFAEVIEFQPLKDMYYRTDKNQEPNSDELTLPNKRIYYTQITPQPSIGYIMVMQDITPFKEMDKLKSDLIATVSHDLKQPLGVMRGYLDLLQMVMTFDGKAQDFVNMIDKSITNMRNLIDDLLDLARIESGVDLRFEPIPLKSLLLECIEANEGHAHSKQMTIISDIPSEPPIVDGERSRLQQIFNNLISNAIKYTPNEGQVTISAEVRDDTVRVAVKDTGLGISPEDQPHIFDRFYRVRRTETESIDGTGLGLAIVRKLVEAHKGKIRLESKLGEGSTFFVTLPTSKNGAIKETHSAQ